MSTAPDFSQPGGDRFKVADHNGHLTAFVPTEYLTGLPNPYGPEPKDAVQATAICITCGTEHPDSRIFQGPLVGALKSRIGETVLGRIGQAPTKKGNPAWVLETFTDADVQAAKAYWTSRTEASPAVTATAPTPAQQPAPAAPAGNPNQPSIDALKQSLGAEVIPTV